MYYSKQEKERARFTLLRHIPDPSTKLYCIVRSVSRSGTHRKISVFANTDDNLVCLDNHIMTLFGYKISKGAIPVKGCGMDMCYGLTEHVKRELFPDYVGNIPQNYVVL